MKILQIEFKFLYIDFYSRIINIDVEAIHSMIHMRHLPYDATLNSS
jgi:hypothetical protein